MINLRPFNFRRLLVVVMALACIGILLCGYADHAVDANARGKTFSSTDHIPPRQAGLLLGTARTLADGSMNKYYENRITAALELLKAGKIKYLLISGDNSRVGYDEPGDMRRDLISRGADSSRIYLDYAGFRTFDSVVRARDIFSQRELIVISQRFHNERAIYIAEKEGVSAIGYNAADVSAVHGLKTSVREVLARVKMLVDLKFGAKPHFLGEKVKVG